MALPTNVITNGFTFTVSAAGGSSPVAYECAITNLEEVIATYGGDEIQTSCGVLRTPLRSSIVGIKATIVEDLSSTGMFRHLRETACAGTEVCTYTGTTSATEGATNPEWGGTVSGWTMPAYKAQASGGYPTVDVEFSFSAVAAVDVT